MVAATITFDTLKFATRLEEAGVPGAQARAEAEVMRETLGEVLTAHAQSLQATFTRDMLETRTQADTAIARLEHKVDVGFAEVRKDIEMLEQRTNARFTLLKWMLGLLLGGMTSMIVKMFL